MKHKPRGFQVPSVDHAVEFLRKAERSAMKLYAAPTGVGKSVIQLCVKERVEAEIGSCAIVTPRDEIVVGLMDKLGCPDGNPDELNIWTPIRMRNRMLDGSLRHPSRAIIDESHHETAETYQQLDLLMGSAPKVGYTATPYRGTPKGTKELLERWGEPMWLITYEEAEKEGYISVPTFEVLPLVDDDVVEVRSGEFAVDSLEANTVDRLGDLADHCRRWHNGTLWDRPTVFALPSTSLCIRLRQELAERGLPAAIVSAQTPKSDRWSIFDATVSRAVALININVVSEGVDLPLRRLVDVAPTMSPVKWVQQLGRITRPTDGKPPEYIGCCRNVLRHCYALEGAVPVSAVIDADAQFGPSKRGAARVLGTEALGRFKPTEVKLVNGLKAELYALSVLVGRVAVEYVCILHPMRDAVWATKVNVVENGVKKWGNWVPCAPPVDLKGFSSVPPREITERQRNWWSRSAAGFGLDPEQEVTRKNFQALPVLCDTGENLR